MHFGFVYLILTGVFVYSVSSLPTEQALLRHADSNRTISATLFAELEELARIVDISYCVGTGTGLGIFKPFKCLSRCGDFENFELVTTWNTGPLLSDSCGYIALSHPPNPRRIIIAFRGTYSIANTIADLSTVPQEYIPYPGDDGDDSRDVPKCTNCTVHTGFYTSWRHTRAEILPHISKALKEFPDYKVTLVGHSLGGAVAAFAALELLNRGFTANISITTFGEPRIGNDALASYINARFNLSESSVDPDKKPYRRVTHISDPVPQLPLEEWGYMPHCGEIFISKPDLPPSVADIWHCEGNEDPGCVARKEEQGRQRHWTFPSRFKLWQLFFAHRDYFWRLGLCIPGGDPFSHWEVEGNLEL